MIKLPKNAVDIIRGQNAVRNLADGLYAAYWFHGCDNGTAQLLWSNIHTDFERLADALGYTIARNDGAQAEEVTE